ncbi:unnamed protein product [Vitrella brassicaformis CCMP3155]|uniref:Uncharacterized protein n=2 Tax=Vitrella brassicaformis TaxID=1169539 RepID=A0A0G4FL64_VITBC|nr:unnamed protein product [Vitrella brassicaformis CCMP3155]|eukprot:CEM14649.1 unnamed protein product [Vitrella brassicaformis CCMP3155]
MATPRALLMALMVVVRASAAPRGAQARYEDPSAVGEPLRKLQDVCDFHSANCDPSDFSDICSSGHSQREYRGCYSGYEVYDFICSRSPGLYWDIEGSMCCGSCGPHSPHEEPARSNDSPPGRPPEEPGNGSRARHKDGESPAFPGSEKGEYEGNDLPSSDACDLWKCSEEFRASVVAIVVVAVAIVTFIVVYRRCSRCRSKRLTACVDKCLPIRWRSRQRQSSVPTTAPPPKGSPEPVPCPPPLASLSSLPPPSAPPPYDAMHPMAGYLSASPPPSSPPPYDD